MSLLSTGVSPGRHPWLPQVILALLWFVVPIGLAYVAFSTGLHFFGESSTAAERSTSEAFWVASALSAVGLALFGLMAARSARSGMGTIVFVLMLLASLVFSAWIGLVVHDAHRNDPRPQPQVTTCQEHSGGDTDCPGG